MSTSTSTSNLHHDPLLRFFQSIPKHLLLCFSSGMIFGILTHLQMLTNKLPNHDDINNFASAGVTSTFGRWMLNFLGSVGGTYSNPMINGILTIFFLSLSACIIMHTWKLTNTTTALLLPALFVSFPSVAGTLSFMFTADCYAIAIFMATLASFLLRRYRYGFLPATLLLILSLATYQSYICFSAGILVIGLLLDLLREGNSSRKLAIKGLIQMLTLGVAMLLYIGITRLLFPSIATESYGGIGQMGHVDLSIFLDMARSYKRILEYFVIRPFSFSTTFMQVLNILTVLGIIVMSIVLVARRKFYRSIQTMALGLFLALMLPLALAFVYVMAPDANTSVIMLYQYVLVYLLFLALMEESYRLLPSMQSDQSNAQKKKALIAPIATIPIRMVLQKLVPYVLACILLLILYQNYLLTNQYYFRTYIAYERSYAYYTRLVTRLEEHPDYQYGDPVLLLGNPAEGEPTAIRDHTFQDEQYADMAGYGEANLITPGVRTNFLRIYLGISIPYGTDSYAESILASEQYQQMPSYPDDGCVAQIDGVWIVKLGSN